jgi:hypothetical protein
LINQSYNVFSGIASEAAMVGIAQVEALKILQLSRLSPYMQRELSIQTRKLRALVKRAKELRSASTSSGFSAEFLEDLSAQSAEEIQALRAVIGRFISGAVLDTFVCAFVLTIALQALVAEAISVDTKLKLRGKLAEALVEQQRAPLPDLRELLYHDIKGEIVLYAPDYQPTDPVELERMMGGQEVYRAFLLATIA